jgi:hypothetical protein
MHNAGMDMDHGNMGHGDMDMGAKCSMNVMTSIDAIYRSLSLILYATYRCSTSS